MSNTIIHKHGSGVPADGTLQVAELGFDTLNKKLYVGYDDGNGLKSMRVGGEGTQTIQPLTISDLTYNGSQAKDATSTINSMIDKKTKALTAESVGALPNTTKIPTALADLTVDATHRLVTDTEKTAWNNTIKKSASSKQTVTTSSGDTALVVNSASSNSYIEFQGQGAKMGYIGVTQGGVPVFYDSTNRVLLHSGNYSSYMPTKLPNPNKLVLTGAVSAEYDGSGEITVEIPIGEAETETVLSDNLLDKSLLTKGQVFYYGGSGYQLVNSTYSHYGFIPLRGSGTYRTKFQKGVHSSTNTRIALVNDANTWVVNVTGTCAETGEDGNWVDFEFIVTEAHIAAGATKVAFDVYELYLGKTMIVKDRAYPDEYIPYGYIEVATDSGKKQNNVLSGKTAVFLGDSICAGTTVGTSSPYYGYGWGGMIGEANRMNWTNYGKNGGTITHRGADGTCISKIADTAIAEHPNADYVIFEGGCNDADQMRDTGLGAISADYATFDTATFSGALESLILKLVMAYPSAKIGYIIPQKMYTGYSDYTAANHIHRKYFDRAMEICQKWGIPVIDIWNTTPLNPKLSTSSIYYVETNGQHLTEAGYKRITPPIEAWMRML